MCNLCKKDGELVGPEYWSLFVALTLLLVALFALSGCLDYQPQSKKGQETSDKRPSDTTFVYTYSNAGKPVDSARVRGNGKIPVVVEDSATHERFNTEIDGGGWILVRPDSPIQR